MIRTTPTRRTQYRRLKYRITLQMTEQECAAIAWLNRLPNSIPLPKDFEPLRRLPRRTIAKKLSAAQLQTLVSIHERHKNATIQTPPL